MIKMAKLKALARRRRAVLRLSVHGSASEVNRSGGDAQVVLCHRYLAIFHPFVEQLTVFHTSVLVLASFSILRVLDFDLHAITRAIHDGIMSGTCQKVRTLCVTRIFQSKTRYGQTYMHRSTTSD